MRLAQRAGWAWLVAIAMALVTSHTAWAEGKRSDNAEYQRLVQQALHEYELGNFAEAKAFFAQAHALAPNARTLRGLGMSAYELRYYVEAIGYFESALNSTERPLTVTMRGEVSQLLRQARGFVAKVRVSLDPASAELRIDTRPVEKDAAGYILLDPGSHDLVAQAPDYEQATRTIRTDGGEELTINLVLQRHEEPKPSGVAEATAPAAPPQAVKPVPQSSSSVGPWVLIATSSAVAVAGGVMLAVMVSKKNFVEHPKGTALYDEGGYRAAEKLVLPLSIGGFAALGVGVAGLIAGVAWKVSSSGTDDEDSSQARIDIGPGQVAFHGHF